MNLFSNVTLQGNGTLTLANCTIQEGSDFASRPLTIGSQQTLQGSTFTNTQIAINNYGTVNADVHLNTFPFVLPVSSPFNHGTLEATNGGNLSVSKSANVSLASLDNSNGLISANGANSTVTLTGISISGGSLSTDANGHILLQSGSSLSNLSCSGNLFLASGSTSLNNITLAGTVSQSQSAALSGTITNNANWTQTTSSGLLITSNTTLAGNGTLSLLASNLYSATAVTLTIGPSQTLQGSSDSALVGLSLNNLGVINANLSASPFIIYDTFTNNSAVHATNGANFTLSTAPTNYSAPPTNYSVGTLTGGIWSATSNASLRAPIGIATNAATILLDGPNANFFNDVTGQASALANLSLNAGNLTLSGGKALSTSANLPNTGTLIIGANSSLSTPQLLLNGGTLAGAGAILAPVLPGSAPHTIHPGLPGTNIPATLTLRSPHHQWEHRLRFQPRPSFHSHRLKHQR